MTDAHPETYGYVAEEIENADRLADTPFAELFHEARTTKTHHYTGVAVGVRIRDGELETTSVVKTAQGEHYHVRNDPWDGTITLPVRPFMETETARQELARQLREMHRNEMARQQIEP